MLIAVIDYGIGNLKSVEKAFQYIGYNAVITSSIEDVNNADAIVLPGVGAFTDAMERLNRASLVKLLKDAVISGMPFLGICLGFQLLFEYSTEGGGKTEGLGLLKGKVDRFISAPGLKIPHMGWNSLDISQDTKLFKGLKSPYVYFVHSYFPLVEDRQIVSARSSYGVEFDTAVEKDNIFATQFHPEKSGHAGLQILANWAAQIT